MPAPRLAGARSQRGARHRARPVEILHGQFIARLPHPELHGGKTPKKIWAAIEDQELSFMDFVERESLGNEEGNLFSYLARVMKFAHMLHEATGLSELKTLEDNVRRKLSAVDERVLEDLR